MQALQVRWWSYWNAVSFMLRDCELKHIQAKKKNSFIVKEYVKISLCQKRQSTSCSSNMGWYFSRDSFFNILDSSSETDKNKIYCSLLWTLEPNWMKKQKLDFMLCYKVLVYQFGQGIRKSNTSQVRSLLKNDQQSIKANYQNLSTAITEHMNKLVQHQQG